MIAFLSVSAILKTVSSSRGHLLIAAATFISLTPCACAQTGRIGNRQISVAVSEQGGAYEIRLANDEGHPVLRSYVAAQVNQYWIRSNDYPSHRLNKAEFDDTLGHGQSLTVTSTGLSNRPDLVYSIRVYANSPFGDIQVQVYNRTSQPVTIQAIRSVDSFGSQSVNLGPSESSERVLSDWFSEARVKVDDLGHVPQGMHFAVNSQLIYNRESRQSLFWGALNADRFLTIFHLQTEQGRDGPTTKSYAIDSTGVTEVRLMGKWFQQLPPEDHIQLSLPLAPGATISSEALMFAVGNDYHSLLENYGVAIRKLHHAHVDGPRLMGWWSATTEYNMTVNEGQAYTNAQWLAQHLKTLGYDFVEIDCYYTYSLGEYTHPNAATIPHGMRHLGAEVSSLGLKLGVWVSPFQVGERSWVVKHHKDWLVRSARGQPMEFPGITELNERFYVLDVTNPGAQQYLRQTYRTLVREWGVNFFKLDYMDITAVEGRYYRPHTTALEALKIGLQIIRDAVGNDVLLDKDGSPMLTPVGIVDEGRVDGDGAHSFAIWRDLSSSIMARYYMHRNWFVNDPDSFTLLKEVPKVPMNPPDDTIPWGTLSLNEAQMSIVLAATTGGMFTIGDDLPSLSTDSDRIRLLSNKDLIEMAKLGRASKPLDLMDYSPDDLQPSIAFLREDNRQSMLAVFNWTEQLRSHEFTLADLGLPEKPGYRLYDALNEQLPVTFDGTKVDLKDQPPHSVRLIKIIDESQAPMPPSVKIDGPEAGKINQTLAFSVRSAVDGVLPLDCHWDFGDGVRAEGASVKHTYTLAGTYSASVVVDGIDGVPAQKAFLIEVAGREQQGPPVRYLEKGEPLNEQ